MDAAGPVLWHATEIYARANNSTSPTGSSSNPGRPPIYKAIGITLAVASGLFIGVSFVLKKTGLLKANIKYNEEAGEGYGYLKNFWWWSGMILMILGEICNFVAYAFVDAILVTPLGALSVVITTILSAIFLKERLSFVGKVGCFSCIIGSVVIALNAPQQSSVMDIQQMQHYVIAPGFLVYAGVILAGCLFTALWAGPRYGKKSMFVYLTVCSLIGGLSVVATQGLGAAILAQISGKSQFTHWFLYVLLVFVIGTLLTEIVFLNKALNIFNAALVTPTYYVYFTSATIITSAVLFQGFKGNAFEITTVVLGFLQICSGVILLQLSKSAKDVPDAAIFKGDLDQIREVAAQEEPESEPKADSIRGTAAILRRISTARQHMEVEEARRFFREKHEDQLKPPAENEIVEWDGLRRRKTIIGDGPTMARPRTPRTPNSMRSPLPPLGMSRFPIEDDDDRPTTKQSSHSFLDEIRSRASTVLRPTQWRGDHEPSGSQSPMHPVALTDISVNGAKGNVDTSYHGRELTSDLQPPFQPRTGRGRSDTPRSIAWADKLQPGESTPERHGSLAPEPPLHSARRQFSFNSMFNRMKTGDSSPKAPSSPHRGILRRPHLSGHMKSATEEERLGLVQGDSRTADDDIDEKLERNPSSPSSDSDLEDMPRPIVFGRAYSERPHQASTSTLSTTPFPPYEDHHAYYTNAESYAGRQPSSSSSDNTEVEDGWQIPGGRSVVTAAGAARGANRPETAKAAAPTAIVNNTSSSSVRPHARLQNPLPPLPHAPRTASHSESHHHNKNNNNNNNNNASSYMRVELRSPGHSPSNSSELGVASLSSSSPPSDGQAPRGRRRGNSDWGRGGSGSSGDSDDRGRMLSGRNAGLPARPGAFI